MTTPKLEAAPGGPVASNDQLGNDVLRQEILEFIKNKDGYPFTSHEIQYHIKLKYGLTIKTNRISSLVRRVTDTEELSHTAIIYRCRTSDEIRLSAIAKLSKAEKQALGVAA